MQVDQKLFVAKVLLSIDHVVEELLSFGDGFSVGLFLDRLLWRRLWLALNLLPYVRNLVMKLSFDGVYLGEFDGFEFLRLLLVLEQDRWGSEDLVRVQGQELAFYRPALGGSDLIKCDLAI